MDILHSDDIVKPGDRGGTRRWPAFYAKLAGGLAWTSCPIHGQRINVARTELIGRAHLDEEAKMQKHGLVLTTSAFIVAGVALGANAQQAGDPMMQQQPQVLQQRQELERQQQDRAQSPRRRVEEGRDQDDDRYGGRMTGGGWRYQQDWQRRGAMNPGMMGQGWMLGSGNVGPGPSVMMRMIFTLMERRDYEGSTTLRGGIGLARRDQRGPRSLSNPRLLNLLMSPA